MKKTIAIIGLGPRGTSLLERLLTNIIKNRLMGKVKILLFDKNKSKGYGCHSPKISNYLLVNTISDQITMYFGSEMEKFGIINNGQSFYEWNKLSDKNGKKTDYLSRVKLSEYLEFFYTEQINRMIENNIEFEVIDKEVVDIIYGNSIAIKIKNNVEYQVTFAITSLGHQNNNIINENNCDRLINTSFLKKLNKKSVAIQGLGLTAFDVISELTEGKDGRFKRDENNKLVYLPSGKEPKIYLYSRSGLFLSSRAYNNDT